MGSKKQMYWQLFTAMFHLSAFTFGGGYVIIPLMKKKFVDDLHWIEEEEMLNMAAIAQSTPGAIAVNAAIIVGFHFAGISGALLAILGTILPPLLILTVISQFYAAFRENHVVSAVLKGMMAGVAAVIFDVVITMGSKIIKTKKALPIFILLSSFVAHYIFRVNAVHIILFFAMFGALLYSRKDSKGKELL